MPKQPASFPEPGPALNHFLAGLPDLAARDRARALGEAVCRNGSGRPLPATHLHVSLHNLGAELEFTPALAADLARIIGVAGMPQFDIAFDELTNFPGRHGSLAVVLTGSDDTTVGMKMLRERLGASLRRAGFASGPSRAFEPHMTIAYAPSPVTARRIAPIRWRMREVVLVRSLVGRSHHARLGCWPLTG